MCQASRKNKHIFYHLLFPIEMPPMLVKMHNHFELCSSRVLESRPIFELFSDMRLILKMILHFRKVGFGQPRVHETPSLLSRYAVSDSPARARPSRQHVHMRDNSNFLGVASQAPEYPSSL